MDLVQQLLKASQELFTHLINIPTTKERDDFIERMNQLLDVRGEIINQLKEIEPNPIQSHNFNNELILLDKNIRKQLNKVKLSIADDMKQLQVSKKSEQRYVNPYAAVQVMDGTYYDQKK
ncbi:flagellar protein FliT [Ureibacillus composti]|nr:flagellar protein FliT [Ureibacillus composti]